MSAHVASELHELFKHLRLSGGSEGEAEDGLGLARQWLASLGHQVGALMPSAENASSAGAQEVVSPFDSSLTVRVRAASSADQNTLSSLWFSDANQEDGLRDSEVEEEEEEGSGPEEKEEEDPHSFLLRWARAIERHVDLVTSVVAAFSGSCSEALRSLELPRALAEIRYWAGRCPAEALKTPHLSQEPGVPLPRTCQLFLTSPATALRSIAREVSAAFSNGPRLHRTARVIVSAAADSGAAPIAHLLVQLALLDSPANRHCPLASLPGLSPNAPLADCLVIGDGATAVGSMAGAMKVSARNGARGVTIVCESADTFAAAEAAIEGASLWCAGQEPGSSHLVLAQESIWGVFLEQLSERLSKRLVAFNPQGDVGALASERQQRKLAEALSCARSDGADPEKLGVMIGLGGSAPLLITGAQPASAFASAETQEGLDGSFLYVLPFRSAKEALTLANHAPRRLRASLWSEVAAQTGEMAQGLRFRHVEINCVRPFDARVGEIVDASEEWLLQSDLGRPVENGLKPAATSIAMGGLFRSEKTQAGGVRDAVSVAVKAAPKWSVMTPSERRTALRSPVAQLAKDLGPEGALLADLLVNAEDITAGRYWAIKRTDFVGHVTVDRSPRGVVAILADLSLGLASLCTAALRALLLGNAVVLVTARAHADALIRSGLGKIDAVSICPFPESSPNSAPEAMAAELASAPGLAGILFTSSGAAAQRLARTAAAKGTRGVSLERCAERPELVIELCAQHKAVWAPVLDVFAN